MEVIRRAISMPLLCRQDLDPRPRRHRNVFSRPSFVRLRIKTWTRLMDSRNGNKIHPARNEEKGPGPPPGGDTGSSVDLTPSLMTIYDNYASADTPNYESLGTTIVQVNDRLNHNHNHVTFASNHPQTSAASSGMMEEEKDDTVVMATQDTIATTREHTNKEARVTNHESLGLDNKNTVTSLIPMVTNINEAVDINNEAMVTNDSMATGVSPRNTQGEDTLSCRCGEEDGPPSALGNNSYTDAKKRPLSVSSTSSSTSSTSSLPRQQRKKVAAMTTPLATNSLSANNNNTMGDSHPGKVSSPIPPYMAVMADLQLDTLTDEDESDQGAESFTYGADFLSKSEHAVCSSVEQSPQHRPGDSNGTGLSYIDKVVAEILETEKTYVRDLQEIIQGYLQHLRSVPQLMCSDYVDALFCNVEAIHRFNRMFVSELECCHGDPTKVAQCFVDKNEGFVIYTEYCTNYPRAVEVLTECMRNPITAEVFKHQQVALSHSLPLGAYLLKPVQRILKYHLLLQNILNNMEEDHIGRDIAQEALSSMTNVAQHINEMKRKHEHAVRIQEIQSLLSEWDGEDLTTYGDLVLEDMFRMHGAKACRHLFLFKKGVLIAKRKEDGGLIIKGSIMCSNLMLIESIPREPLSFHLIPFDNPRMQYTVAARNLEQKRLWCLELKRLILENYNAVIPDKAKELVMMLGKSKDEEVLQESPGDTGGHGTKKQHHAPEYLEKRRMRRKSATILPDFGLLKGQKHKKGARKGDTGSPKASPPSTRRRASEAAVPINRHHKSRITQHKVSKNQIFSEEESPSPSPRNGYAESRQRSRSVDSLDNTSLVDPPYDNASRPISRLSSGSNESNKQCNQETSDRVPDLLEPGHSRPGSRTSSQSVSPARRPESFRIATTLHRVDSRAMDETLQSRRRYGDRSVSPRPRRTSSSSTDVENDNVECNNTQKLDDGYVSVIFTDSGFQVDTTNDNNAESPYNNVMLTPPRLQINDWDSMYGDYVELPARSPQGSRSPTTNDNNNNHNQGHRPVRRLVGNCARSNSGLDNQVSQNGANRSPAITVHTGATSLNKTRTCQTSPSDIYQMWNSPESPNVFTFDHPGTGSSSTDDHTYDNFQNVLYDNVVFNQSKHKEGSHKQDNTIDGAAVTLVNSHSTVCSTQVSQAPMVITQSKPPSAANNKSSSSVNTSRSNSLEDDPWVPLSKKSQIASNLSLAKKTSSLRRSSSLSSLCDSREDLISQKRKSHKRQPSDTLVFADRNAYVASDFPTRNIRPDSRIQRIIARLATPPRDMGPSNMLDEIKRSKEHGRVVTRYATPPRSAMDPARMYTEGKHAVEDNIDIDLDLATKSKGQPEMRRSYRRNMSASALSSVRLSTDSDKEMWNDLERYIQGSPASPSTSSRRFPLNLDIMSSSCGPDLGGGSSSGVTSTTSSTPTSPSLSSPSHSSGDGIMDSLKHAMFNLTSRFTGKGTRSLESSPCRNSPRTRSVGALEDLRIDPKILQESTKSARDLKKEKRHRFVYQLARAYSDRIKNKHKGSLSRTSDPSLLAKQLSSLLKENKPGSSVIGARIASSKPIVLGTYTLPRHRPPRPQEEEGGNESDIETPTSTQSTLTTSSSPAVTTSSIITYTSTTDTADTANMCTPDQMAQVTLRAFKNDASHLPADGAHDSGVLDMGVRDMNLDDMVEISTSDDYTLYEATPKYEYKKDVEQGSTDSNEEIYFYEKRFVEDLERSFSDEFFRDSAVYSDDGATAEVEPGSSLKCSIKDTVKMIENRHRAKAVPKIEIKRVEKAQGIKEIMKNLENTSTSPKSDMATCDLSPEKVKTVRDRTRELVECATLTRIRQDTCTVGDDHHRVPPGGSHEHYNVDHEPAAEEDSPTRKGYWWK